MNSKTIANWDGSANTRTVAMTYDNTNNRVTQYTDTHGSNKTLAYDFRGNVTALGGQGFYYGLTNQPQSLTGTHTGSYTYDGNLRRVRSEIAGVKIFNVYDSAGTLVHIDDKGTGTKTDYVKGAGMTLARIKNGVPTYVHLDHLGSTVATTSLTGVLGPKEHYTPFGMTLINHPSNDNQAGFTGHIKDAATGLNYMQARYYDPVMGRFLSVDPVDFAQTGATGMFNRYSYTVNNPINLIDPRGTHPQDWGHRTGSCAAVGPCTQGGPSGSSNKKKKSANKLVANNTSGSNSQYFDTAKFRTNKQNLGSVKGSISLYDGDIKSGFIHIKARHSTKLVRVWTQFRYILIQNR